MLNIRIDVIYTFLWVYLQTSFAIMCSLNNNLKNLSVQLFQSFNDYNQWPWMTLKSITRSVSKRMRLLELNTKIWMQIDPYYQRRRQ